MIKPSGLIDLLYFVCKGYSKIMVPTFVLFHCTSSALKLLQVQSISPIPGSPTWAELEICLIEGQGTHWQQVFLHSELEQAISLIQPLVQAEGTVAERGTWASCPCPSPLLSSGRQPSPVTAPKAAAH